MAKKPRKAQRAKVPITRHPLFPAMVALWFAAAFGLGSLAVRPSLLESLVLATHIDLLIPAAAPPLGLTARIVLALALAIGGGLLGAFFARRIAAPKVEARPLRRSGAFMKDALRAQESQDDGTARRPISAHEEIGEGAIVASEAGVTLGGRRRSLAIEEEDDEFRMYETAPLPGGQPPVFDITAFESVAEAESEMEAHELDLASFEPLPSVAVQPPVDAALEPAPNPVFDAPPRQEFVPAPAAEVEVAADRPFANPQMAAFSAAPIDFSKPKEVALSAAGVEPLDFSRPDPALTPAPFAAPAAEVTAANEPAAFAPADPEPALPENAAPTNTDAVVAALDDLGLIELTERFAQTLRQRRERLTGKAPAVAVERQPEVVTAPVPAAFAPLAAEPAAPADFSAPDAVPEASPLPAAMRPLDLDAFEDEDEDLSSLLPLRKFAPAAEPAPVEPVADEAVAATESDEADDAAIEAEGYSSLLDLVKQPETQTQFVRIEEPEPEDAEIEPVVIFPGQAARQASAPFAAPAASFSALEAAPSFAAPEPVAPVAAEPAAPATSPLRQFDSPAAALPGQTVAPQAAAAPAQDPEETERALRAALATLQRMSGAA